MGATSSSLQELASNDYLRRLVSQEGITSNDPFWNQLLSFSIQLPHSISDSRLLEEATTSLLKNFAINNCRTGNFSSLVRVFIRRASELPESVKTGNTIFIWQAHNALFIVRHCCKYFIESLSQEVVSQEFDTRSGHENGVSEGETPPSLIDDFLVTLTEILIHVPVTPQSYSLHLEVLNTFVVLLSTQMYTSLRASELTFYKHIMVGKCSMHGDSVVQALLQNYIDQTSCPPDLLPTHGGGSALGNITSSVASGLWWVVTLGFGGRTAPESDGEPVSDKLLANQSLLVLLLLANHCTNDKVVHNPYRQALFSFVNSQEIPSEPDPEQGGCSALFSVNYTRLYDVMSKTLTDDQTTLMLYLLLHRNAMMKAFILSRTNIDQMVMPVLKTLYHAQDRNSHHIYMALIIILILSEDDVFNKSIHDMKLSHVPWFRERHITDITLGGFLVLVVIRTIQYNITRMRDKYLHTNCLAALANMSSQFNMLHPYVTQRLVNLFSKLCKKHSVLVNQIRIAAMETKDQSSGSENDTEQDLARKRVSLIQIDDTDCSLQNDNNYGVQDLSVLEEVIRMVLEIINSCLTHSLHHNPNLVYTLLYKKDDFAYFRQHPTFQDLIQNIDTVLSYFTSKLDCDDKNLSVEQVNEVIDQGIRQFRKDRLKKFPELKFKYVEEDSPEEFFIPYVWSLVYHSSNLYFNPNRIQLFTLTSDDR